MKTQIVTQFFTDPTPRFETFELGGRPKEVDHKAIRSAVVVFNLTPRESNLIGSYRVDEYRSYLHNLKKGDRAAWARVVVSAILIAGIVLSGYRYARYFISSYKDACTKIGSGGWGLFRRVGDMPRELVRSAVMWDFLKKPITVGVVGGFGATLLSFIAYRILKPAFEVWEVSAEIAQFERHVPDQLMNERNESGDFLDPFDSGVIPQQQVESPRFVYLNGSVVKSTLCMRGILLADRAPGYDSTTLHRDLRKIFCTNVSFFQSVNKFQAFTSLYDDYDAPLISDVLNGLPKPPPQGDSSSNELDDLRRLTEMQQSAFPPPPDVSGPTVTYTVETI